MRIEAYFDQNIFSLCMKYYDLEVDRMKSKFWHNLNHSKIVFPFYLNFLFSGDISQQEDELTEIIAIS